MTRASWFHLLDGPLEDAEPGDRVQARVHMEIHAFRLTERQRAPAPAWAWALLKKPG